MYVVLAVIATGVIAVGGTVRWTRTCDLPGAVATWLAAGFVLAPATSLSVSE